MTMIPISVSTRVRVIVSMTAGLVIATFSGCSSEDPRWSPDCVSPFHFRDREYLLGPEPPDVERVKPGNRIGEGANESCDQYAPGVRTSGDGSDRLIDPRPVYAFPSVPAEQALVLVNADGQSFVLLATEKPAGGWDPVLRRWLRAESRR